jgi:hypothetical protein
VAGRIRPQNPAANACGFALTGTLILIPLALILLAGLTLLTLAIKNRTTAFAICRQEAWQAQRTMATHLTRLMSLNSQARRLRSERQLAENALKAALGTFRPELIAAARFYLSLVVNQQVLLRAEQKRLLFAAKLTRLEAKHALFQKERLQSVVVTKFLSPVSTLAVEESPKGALTPDYIPVTDFKAMQRLQFHVLGDLMTGAPDWLLNLSQLPNLQFRGRCAASIQAEGQKWQPKIIAAK